VYLREVVKLSVLIPVFNERYYVAELVKRVLAAPLPDGMERELVIVDDGSTDGTRELLAGIAAERPGEIRYLPQPENRGKGAALRVAIQHASGDFAIFQDADLEYDPNDYRRLLVPLLAGQADVVFGSRFQSSEYRRVLYYWHALGNRLLTTLSNLLTDLNLTDMETCYKVFRTEILKTIPIRNSGFGIEPELTAKVAKRGLRVYEVPITYEGRTYLEGKKITWRDGLTALFVLLREAVLDDTRYDAAGHAVLGDLSHARRFNAYMADTIRPFVGHSVLEVGAGIGNLTAMLLPRDRYIASDVDPAHVRLLRSWAHRRRGLEVARIDLADPSCFESVQEAVDTVVCLNVLEHVDDPKLALANMRGALEPGGRAIILVPQGAWLYSDLDREIGHRKRYVRADLRQEIEAAGFEVEELFDFNRSGVPGWWLNFRLGRGRRVPQPQLRFYDRMIPLLRRVDRWLPWHGLSLIAVARKPSHSAG
jgi:glycosyltransferase involved in cell wall biosynthesis